jgi:hypothetical protein
VDKHEKDIIWEALVLIDAIQKNAISELNRLEQFILREDVICIPRYRIDLITRIGKMRQMLTDILIKKKPVMELLEMKYEEHS